MREIKFKYIFSDGKEFKSTVLSLAAIENCQLKAFTNNIPSSFELVAVCQFTGLLDKQGVEIYEGDIVKIKDFLTNDNKTYYDDIGIVEFENGMFLICNEYPSIANRQIIEVIGNIYENEELLC